MFIYLIVNRVTGKYYVGQHRGDNLKKYLRRKFSEARHYRGSSYLFRSMLKHPLPCDWSIHALLSDVQTKPELDQHERDFIAFLKSTDPEYGYNICRGGEGNNSPMSEKTKARLKEVGNPVFLRSPEQEARRKAAVEKARQEQGGSFLTTNSVEKIKTARAQQDEAQRLAAFNEWKEQKLAEDHDHFKKIGGRASKEDKARAGRMGSREDKQRAGRIAAKSLPKAMHTRWHANRGIIKEGCTFCYDQQPNAQS
jgi:hypothetical protein